MQNNATLDVNKNTQIIHRTQCASVAKNDQDVTLHMQRNNKEDRERCNSLIEVSAVISSRIRSLVLVSLVSKEKQQEHC